MAKYYATVAGLPNIAVEDRKLPFSTSDFKDELLNLLSNADRKLFELLLLEEENRFLLNYLEDPEKAKEAKEQPTLFSLDDVEAFAEAFKKSPKSTARAKSLPAYFYTYLEEQLLIGFSEEELEEHAETINKGDDEEDKFDFELRPEDRLAMLYYDYAMGCGNAFLEEWFELNLHIKNILAAITCRKLGWDPSNFIVGQSDLVKKLRTSHARDFGIDQEVEFLSTVLNIGEETDITKRERQLDLLKWEWLEESVFHKVFTVEKLLCYYLELQIIERWVMLDDVQGEKKFRQIVASLKEDSNESLEEFKRNQKK